MVGKKRETQSITVSVGCGGWFGGGKQYLQFDGRHNSTKVY